MFEDTLGGYLGFDGKYATIARKQPITNPASVKLRLIINRTRERN